MFLHVEDGPGSKPVAGELRTHGDGRELQLPQTHPLYRARAGVIVPTPDILWRCSYNNLRILNISTIFNDSKFKRIKKN